MTFGICVNHPLNAHTDVSSRVSGVNVGPSLHLHPNSGYAIIEGSGVPHQSKFGLITRKPVNNKGADQPAHHAV